MESARLITAVFVIAMSTPPWLSSFLATPVLVLFLWIWHGIFPTLNTIDTGPK